MKRLAELAPRPKPHTARFYHGTNEAGWLLAQARGGLLPRDPAAVFDELETLVGLPAGSLNEHEGADPLARLDVYGTRIWVAEPFYTAVGYATRGSEFVEFELHAALELRFGWKQFGPEAKAYSANYWAANPFVPLVLALDVPIRRLWSYRDHADPEADWERIHQHPQLREVNYALEPPVPLQWVVAVLDPNDVDPVDRLAPPPPIWASS